MANRSAVENFSLLWERAEPVSRGVTAAPDAEHISRAAFEIADREGLHAVSVKRVATKLGVPALRLEGYLTSREDLLDLMLDAAFGEIELPGPRGEGSDWQADLRAIAHSTQVTAQQHPWLRALAGTRTPCGPNGLRNSERALAAVDGLGLDASSMTQAVNTVLAYVYGFVQLELLQSVSKVAEGDELDRRNHTARYLLERASTGEYPTLARVFTDASHLTAADSFETGLEYILDGIASAVAFGDTGHGADATQPDGTQPNGEPADADA